MNPEMLYSRVGPTLCKRAEGSICRPPVTVRRRASRGLRAGHASTGLSQKPGRSVNSLRKTTRSKRTEEPGYENLPSQFRTFPETWSDTEQRGTAGYRLTRDNRRRPKEVTDVGATHSTAGRWRTEAQRSHCREGGAGHHRTVRRTTGRTLEPTNGLTRPARHSYRRTGSK